jgi:hypothetical protein
MKKLFSISFAFLILLAGMHLSIASHICGGEVAAVKWSLTGKNATCGMESTKQSCPVQNGIHSNCCHNEIAYFSVDNNYNPTSFQIQEVSKSLIQVFDVPVSFSFNSSIAANSFLNNVIPPDIALTSAVSLADICIFRI